MRRAWWTAAGLAVAVHVVPAGSWLPGPRLRWLPRLAGVGRPGHLALTFDDGPDPDATPAFLDTLDRLGWRATFFVVGEQARRHRSVLAETVAAGHEVALHGDAHRMLLQRPPWAAYRDLARARDTVAESTGRPVHWFRPPYGVLTGPAFVAARSLGLRVVLWSAWGREWTEGATAQSVADELRAGRLDGGTALLHDSDATSPPGSWKAALGALDLLADTVAERGLSVGPLGEHDIPWWPANYPA